jgi:hypothetical protein
MRSFHSWVCEDCSAGSTEKEGGKLHGRIGEKLQLYSIIINECRETNNAEREDADEFLRRRRAELYKDYDKRVTVAVEEVLPRSCCKREVPQIIAAMYTLNRGLAMVSLL